MDFTVSYRDALDRLGVRFNSILRDLTTALQFACRKNSNKTYD